MRRKDRRGPGIVTVSANGAASFSWKGVAHVQAVPKNVERRRNESTEQGAFMAGAL
jgi:hypothetical protein